MPTSTFGDAAGGGSNLAIGANGLHGTVFTAPADVGTAVSISAYVKNANAGRYIKCALVTHADLKLVANGVGTASAELGAAYAWKTSTFASPPTLTPGVAYVLMVTCNSTASYLAYDDGAANAGHEDGSNDYTTPTDPTDAGHSTKECLVYCTYNVVASSGKLRLAQLKVGY